VEWATDILDTAALVADPSRLTMLMALMDGRAHTARELASAADVTAPTASFHLEKLVSGGLLGVTRQGRFRYFRIESEDIARMLESLLALHHAPKPRRIPLTCPPALREARVCYNHIAGRLGVRIYRALMSGSWLAPRGADFVLLPAAAPLLAPLNIAVEECGALARPCLDWSEREFHLAGPLGDLLYASMIERRWLLRGAGRRLTLTAEGERQLRRWPGMARPADS
jgi:DNA-binding transcriptional ArsR family regulator